MNQAPTAEAPAHVVVRPVRTLPSDVGVAVVVLGALLLALLLRYSVDGGTKPYQSPDQGFSIEYPSSWRPTDVTDTLLLRVENPQARSAYKTNVSIEVRDLDPSSPPTIQELVDRRVVQAGGLTGYHFISSMERNVAGARASEVEYAFVSQPIGTLRSASLPVVVRTRENIVVARDRTYYITLSAPEDDFARATEQFDRMLQSVKIR
ncbi:MAG TPA: hypothetical protein VM409_02370 [Chloroflexia bacterium]|nr:hypothetical protein [Chloroflexia bacterium]